MMTEKNTVGEAKLILDCLYRGKFVGRVSFDFNQGGISLVDVDWKDTAEKMAKKLQNLFKEEK